MVAASVVYPIYMFFVETELGFCIRSARQCLRAVGVPANHHSDASVDARKNVSANQMCKFQIAYRSTVYVLFAFDLYFS